MPTVWDKSIYLQGEIGKNISVARRKGNVWYVGNAAGPVAWAGNVTLNFLEPDKTYLTTIYEDGVGATITKREVKVKKGDKIPFNIAAAGGQAMMISLVL